VLLIIGVLVVVVLPGYLSRDKMEDNEHAPVKLRWLWQLTGVIVGAMLLYKLPLTAGSVAC